jgi:hypothetical protein
MHDESTVRVPLRARDGSVRAYTIIDATDADFVNQWEWRLSANGYAVRGHWLEGRCQKVYLHRTLLGLTVEDGIKADHISRDRLDNRRANLRCVTTSENGQNRSNQAGSSIYRGVAKHKRSGKWQTAIQINGKKVYLGYFVDEHEAGEAVREARLRLMPYAVD